jgi:hypothetical protein
MGTVTLRPGKDVTMNMKADEDINVSVGVPGSAAEAELGKDTWKPDVNLTDSLKRCMEMKDAIERQLLTVTDEKQRKQLNENLKVMEKTIADIHVMAAKELLEQHGFKPSGAVTETVKLEIKEGDKKMTESKEAASDLGKTPTPLSPSTTIPQAKAPPATAGDSTLPGGPEAATPDQLPPITSQPVPKPKGEEEAKDLSVQPQPPVKQEEEKASPVKQEEAKKKKGEEEEEESKKEPRPIPGVAKQDNANAEEKALATPPNVVEPAKAEAASDVGKTDVGLPASTNIPQAPSPAPASKPVPVAYPGGSAPKLEGESKEGVVQVNPATSIMKPYGASESMYSSIRKVHEGGAEFYKISAIPAINQHIPRPTQESLKPPATPASKGMIRLPVPHREAVGYEPIVDNTPFREDFAGRVREIAAKIGTDKATLKSLTAIAMREILAKEFPQAAKD